MTTSRSGHIRLVVKEEGTLLAFLQQHQRGRSKTSLRQLLADGRLHVNGIPVRRLDGRLNPGDVVEIVPLGRPRAIGRKVALLYEDEHLIVIHKQAGLLSQRTASEKTATVADQVTAYLRARYRRGRAYLCHRLDYEVSGVLALAKSRAVRDRLRQDFAAHKVERRYWAVVEGRLEPKTGTIRSRLVEADDLRVHSTVAPGRGRLAVTDYRVLRATPAWSFVEVCLHTGRKHQIRVHLAERGHPVLGDRLYGSRRPFQGRLALHAFLLRLRHPITGEVLEFRTEMPPAFQRYGPRP